MHTFKVPYPNISFTAVYSANHHIVTVHSSNVIGKAKGNPTCCFHHDLEVKHVHALIVFPIQPVVVIYFQHVVTGLDESVGHCTLCSVWHECSIRGHIDIVHFMICPDEVHHTWLEIPK